MKCLEMVEDLQKEEKNKNKIILVKCGVFFVAIGKDAILLHEILGLNVTCIKPSVNGKIICRKMAKKNVVFPTYFLYHGFMI